MQHFTGFWMNFREFAIDICWHGFNLYSSSGIKSLSVCIISCSLALTLMQNSKIFIRIASKKIPQIHSFLKDLLQYVLTYFGTCLSIHFRYPKDHWCWQIWPFEQEWAWSHLLVPTALWRTQQPSFVLFPHQTHKS